MADEHDAILLRQIEYFRSDERLVERASEFRGKSPEECWAETVEQCRQLDWFLERMEPEIRERVMAPEPLSDEIVSILEAMQRHG